MSGTSRDGMDAALLWTDGEDCILCQESLTLPYDESFRAELVRLCAQKERLQHDEAAARLVEEMSHKLAEVAYRALERLLEQRENKVSYCSPSLPPPLPPSLPPSLAPSLPPSLAVVGFHGHTIFHAPESGETLQIGDGAYLARRCKSSVVCNFRQEDMKHGGQGAPLTPLYHRAIVRQLRARDSALGEQPVVFVNIGGVANATWIAPRNAKGEESMLGFDIGPGNALLDDWVSSRTRQAFDENGELARKGRVREPTLQKLLADPFFALPPPKSLDRDGFSLAALRAAGLSLEDGAATLTAFLVESLWLARNFFPSKPCLWLLCGGGRKNRAIVEGLRRKVATEKFPDAVRCVDALGFDGDALEAQAFAYLAVRRLRGLPTTYPSLTGASRATCGGDLYHAA